MPLSTPVYRLKQRAKSLARREGIPLHAALDRIAAREGFSSWSLLAARLAAAPTAAATPAAEAFRRLNPGDLVLLGARPGQGKTLMGLRLAVEAMRAGRQAAFFSLEYTERNLFDRFRAIGVEPAAFDALFTFDCCDAICAAYIAGRLAAAPCGTLAVIDYLQLLDQRRDTPELAAQVRALGDLAKERGLILVFIAQIDRRYDPARKPCPDLDDVRLPNPLDLSLFGKACFLHAGPMTLRSV